MSMGQAASEQIHDLSETSLSYLKIRTCAPCSFQENKGWSTRMPIAQPRQPSDLKRVGQRNFLTQRLNAPVSFVAGQILLKQFWLVRLDRERAQGDEELFSTLCGKCLGRIKGIFA